MSPTDSTATTLADLKGKRVAGQTGTTGLDYLKANADANGYEIVEYADFPSAVRLAAHRPGRRAQCRTCRSFNQFVKDN